MSSSAAVAIEDGQVIGCHTADEFDKQFQRGIDLGKLVVVDFTATWCPPCRFIAPVFAELAKKITHAIFLKVDVDELKTVAEKWGIEAMPTFLFFKDGKIVHKIVGADKEDLLRSTELHAAAPLATA